MSSLTLPQRELAAIGASLGSNCIPCIKYHIQKGREAGLSGEAIAEAIEVAEAVRQTPARRVREAAEATLRLGRPRPATTADEPTCGRRRDGAQSNRTDSSCCGPGVDP